MLHNRTSADAVSVTQDSFNSKSMSVSSKVKILKTVSDFELFNDEIGQFFVDTHGRKLYTKEGSDKHYQLNEDGVLVEVRDEEGTVYFYDRCGRYRLDEQHERVYKAHTTASEYMLDALGNMCKTMEMIDGVEYRYNEYGRYILTAHGERIYKDDEGNELEEDGLGNLVKPQDQRPHPEICEQELLLKGESAYLKKNVGKALRHCVAKTVLMQPSNPIKYLAQLLKDYRLMLIEKERRRKEEIEIQTQREYKMAQEREEAERERLKRLMDIQYGGEDASFDSNLLKYETLTANY